MLLSVCEQESRPVSQTPRLQFLLLFIPTLLAFRAPFPRASDQEMGLLSVSPVSAALQGPQVLAFLSRGFGCASSRGQAAVGLLEVRIRTPTLFKLLK